MWLLMTCHLFVASRKRRSCVHELYFLRARRTPQDTPCLLANILNNCAQLKTALIYSFVETLAQIRGPKVFRLDESEL